VFKEEEKRLLFFDLEKMVNCEVHQTDIKRLFNEREYEILDETSFFLEKPK